jgi:hypothetical protein
MKSNVATTMEAPFHVDHFSWFQHALEASCILRHSFLEIFKLIEIATTQVFRLIEDKQPFSPSLSWNQRRRTTSMCTHTLLLVQCILKLSILWISSHVMHALMIGRSENLGKHWIKELVATPMFQGWNLLAKVGWFFHLGSSLMKLLFYGFVCMWMFKYVCVFVSMCSKFVGVFEHASICVWLSLSYESIYVYVYVVYVYLCVWAYV